MQNEQLERRMQPLFEIVGEFSVTSGEMQVADPCYDKSVLCTGILKVPNGKWMAAVRRQDEGGWGRRIKELMVWHSEFGTQEAAEDSFIDSDIDVGVDSGQCGFFDAELYPDGERKYKNKDEFYRKICDMTLTPKSVGLVDFGVASSSGFG